jgi:carboxyl-terminal processing protease
MKNLLVVLLFALLPFAQAQKFPASPGQDLFDQAAFFLETQYFGPSKVAIVPLVAKYQLEVDRVCTPAEQKCSYETVEPLIAAMLDELEDLHAYYISPAQYAAEQQQSTGTDTSQILRVGFSHNIFVEYQQQILLAGGFSPQVIDLQQKGELKVLSLERIITQVTFGSPAEKAGLRYGDRWIGYNGTRFSSLTNPEAYNAFIAAFGTIIQAKEKVTMQILRGVNKTPLDITVAGELINLVPFPTMVIDENNIATIKIPTFLIQGMGQRVHDLMKIAIEKNVKAVLFNLRGSQGGYNSESMHTIGSFLENPASTRFTPRYNAATNTAEESWEAATSSYVVRNAKGIEIQRYAVKNPIFYKGPIALLVDGGCSSACEYLVSRVERAKRGPILGTRTTGIGDTNTFRFNLINGGVASMPTVRAFWSDGTPMPSFITPQHQILNPEYELFNTGRDPGVVKALEVLGIQ